MRMLRTNNAAYAAIAWRRLCSSSTPCSTSKVHEKLNDFHITPVRQLSTKVGKSPTAGGEGAPFRNDVRLLDQYEEKTSLQLVHETAWCTLKLVVMLSTLRFHGTKASSMMKNTSMPSCVGYLTSAMVVADASICVILSQHYSTWWTSHRQENLTPCLPAT